MARKLKTLGLALVAVLALGALLAEASIAAGEEHEFTTTGSSEDTVLTGEQHTKGSLSHDGYTEKQAEIETEETDIEKMEKEITESEERIEKTETEIEGFHSEVENPVKFVLVETELSCGTAAFRGTVQGEEADSFALYPEFNECKFGTGEFPLTTNNCTFIFDSDTTEGPSHALMSLTCGQEGEGMTLDVGACLFDFPQQEGLNGVTYQTLEEHGPGKRDAIAVTTTVSGMVAISTGGIICGVLGFGFEEQEHSVTLSGEIIITGYAASGEPEGHSFPHGNEQVDWALE